MSTPIVTPNLLQQMRTAQAPMPALPTAPLMPSMPQLPAVAAPVVGKIPTPPTQMQKDQAELDRRVNTGSGIDQIHNPLLRGIARAGDIALSVFGAVSPIGTVLNASLPGTTLHHHVLVNQAERNLANDQATQKAAADTAFIQSNADHTNAETPEVAPNAASTRTLQAATSRHLNDESDNLENPSAVPVPLAQLHANAVQKAIQEGRDPSQDPTVNHLANAIIGLQPGQNKNPVLKESQPIIGPDGKPHVYALDEQLNKVKDEGVHYERPMTVNIGQDRQAKNDVLKAYQPTLDSGERFNVMAESYEKAVKDHDQQAMLNLLANHLGMTMGLQKGARITKDLYQEAAHSTPWLQKVGAQFSSDGYLSGVTLNPNQMRQMVDLAQSRYSEDVKKSRSTASYLGAQDDGPKRVPNAATIRFYVGKANGDPAKAKQLASADGWSIQ